MVERAIQGTRQVESEAQEAKSTSELMDKIITIVNNEGRAPVGVLLGHPYFRRRYNPDQMIAALNIMHEDGRINIQGNVMNLDSIVSTPF